MWWRPRSGTASSRAGDPLLHTHVLVTNLGRAVDDGTWRTLDSRRIYAHAKTAGYVYQAQLRHELSHRLGVEWTPVTNGTADLVGIGEGVIRGFSRRRVEIEAAMAARGETSAKAAQAATLETRRSKDYGVTVRSLPEEHAAEIAARTLARPDAQRVEDLAALLASAGER